MIRPDDHLAALFAQDLPAARDPAFSVAVLEAAARRRFQQDLVLVGLASLAGADDGGGRGLNRCGLTRRWPRRKFTASAQPCTCLDPGEQR